MFRTINQRFYTIAGVLVFLFCLNYAQLAYFINEESRIAAQGENIIDLERNIRNLLNLFFQMRYWERAVFTQEFPDAECNLDYVPNKAREMTVNIALSNSFGFGGVNGSLVFRRFSES